jgi:hypothetical protein
MAARKKTVETMSLFGANVPAEPTSRAELPLVLDDVPAPEKPRLRVVPPPAPVPESEVIVEQTSDGRFEVSLLRNHGTTVAAVFYTRAQLEQLIARAGAALEVG